MASIKLQLDDQVLNEYIVGPVVTIGRLPDNTVVIDSPAVSSHHACVFRDGDRFVVEDLQSTNGTFVNGTRVSRQVLHQGDVVLVGKHQLVFDLLANGGQAEPTEADLSISNQGETVFLDSRKHQELLASLMDESRSRKHEALLGRLLDVEAQAARGAGADAGALPRAVAVLRVVEGRADQQEYSLGGHTSVIGKGRSSLVRLKGWFKPRMALAITHNRQGYVATLLGGRTLINSQPLAGRHELKDGDVLQVSGLTLQFHVKA